MKVILPASSIPDGSVVTKISGTKEYTLASTIKFYGSNAPNDITSDDNSKFLVCIGSIQEISKKH